MKEYYSFKNCMDSYIY